MGRFDPRPGEEPFSGRTEPVRSSHDFPGGTYPDADAPGGIHELRDQVAGENDAQEAKADMDQERRGLHYKAKEEGNRFTQRLADIRSGRVKRGTGGDDVESAADDQVAFERRAAFAYGLGEIAHRLGGIAQNQGDLFAASTRRYPQSGGGGGGGQWRPQRGVRERNIG